MVLYLSTGSKGGGIVVLNDHMYSKLMESETAYYNDVNQIAIAHREPYLFLDLIWAQ